MGTNKEKVITVRLEIPFRYLSSENGNYLKQVTKFVRLVQWIIEDEDGVKGTSDKIVNVGSMTDEEFARWLAEEGYTEKPLNMAKDSQIRQMICVADTQWLKDNKIYRFVDS